LQSTIVWLALAGLALTAAVATGLHQAAKIRENLSSTYESRIDSEERRSSRESYRALECLASPLSLPDSSAVPLPNQSAGAQSDSYRSRALMRTHKPDRQS
jgi:hypothetical protein